MTSISDQLGAAVLLVAVALGSPGCADGRRDRPVPDPELRHELDGLSALLREGKHETAAERSQQILARIEETRGAHSIEAAWILDRHVEALWRLGRDRDPGALALAERAVAIKERTFGGVDPEVADSLRNLAIVLEDNGETARARNEHERILSIHESHLDASDPRVARGVIDLANLMLTLGESARARSLYARALGIQREAGAEPAAEALTLHNLAKLHHDLGEYTEAESLYREALDLRRTLYLDQPGAARPGLDLAWTLNALAILLEELGDYPGARASYDRALALREELLAPDHPHAGWTRMNLAVLLLKTGEYDEARGLLERALAVAEGIDPEHPDVADVEYNLASLSQQLGDHEDARLRFERALRIHEREASRPLRLAATLYGLSRALVSEQENDAARAHLERAVELLAGTVGERHRQYAWALHRLAEHHARGGDLDRAEELYRRTLDIRREALGPEHPDVAGSLEELGRLRLRAADPSDARALFERALAIDEAALGARHPRLAQRLEGLAVALARTGAGDEAMRSALRAEEIAREHLRLTARTLPDRRALRYAAVRSRGLDVAMTLDAAGLVHDAERVWDALCRTRTLILDEMAGRRRAVGRTADPELERLTVALADASRRLANLTLRGPDSVSPERHGELLRRALETKERTESELARRSAAFRRDRDRSRTGLDTVRSSLPAETALVAYARYLHHELSAGSVAAEGRPAYLAFVLAGSRADPVVVPLGDAGEIDARIEAWLDETVRGPFSDRSAQESERAYRTAGARVRERVWDPIVAALGTARRVLVVPAGMLHRVNFAALPVGTDRHLLESGPLLHFLSAERDVVAGRAPETAARGLLSVGGPDFGAPEDGPAVEAAATSTCGNLGSVSFEPLAGAEQESTDIVEIWRGTGESSPADVVHLTRAAATESAFKREAPGKRCVHLATHGFFLDDDCRVPAAATRGITGLVPADDAAEPIGHPLLRSGLALAGANRRRTAAPDAEDGILTAEEITTMDLAGTEWAVLSACDTGVGEVRTDEGVLGLRRAFQIAGVDTVIMSLWPVEDRLTREWMRELYRQRLERDRSTAEAVRAASLHLLERSRREHGTPHPFYWAGFVAVGSWH